MERAVKVLVAVLVIVPVAFVCFVVGWYNWDKYQAARTMRASTDVIAVGDSLDRVEQLVARADAEAGNQPFGSYRLDRSNSVPPRERLQASSWVIQGFWLRTGVTCYRELVVHEEIVTRIEDVFCVNDRWFE